MGVDVGRRLTCPQSATAIALQSVGQQVCVRHMTSLAAEDRRAGLACQLPGQQTQQVAALLEALPHFSPQALAAVGQPRHGALGRRRRHRAAGDIPGECAGAAGAAAGRAVQDLQAGFHCTFILIDDGGVHAGHSACTLAVHRASRAQHSAAG
jgi:hypothetical protein